MIAHYIENSKDSSKKLLEIINSVMWKDTELYPETGSVSIH